MLQQSLSLVKDALTSYLRQRLPDPDLVEVVLDNVSRIEQDEGSLDDKLIISLVNLEEERSLKNARTVRPTGLAAGGLAYENAPVSLNLYLLFSAHFPRNYDNALLVLGHVIAFFQGRRNFNTQRQPLGTPDDFSTNQIDLSFNIYTMTFEQLNHLWGALGGKQLPSALYRVNLVQLEDDQIREGGRLIEQVDGNTRAL